jgi:hypothetical protein
VDGVEPLQRILQRVGLVELERVARLRVDVDPDDLESGLVVADCGPTGSTEEIKQPRAH